MDDLLALVLEPLLQLLADILLQLLFELAGETLIELFGPKKPPNPGVSAMILALLGAAAGMLSVWLFPHRVIPKTLVLSGASLVLAPLATGVVMRGVGELLREDGRQTSDLTSFHGAAIFAFSMALIRWLFVGLSH